MDATAVQTILTALVAAGVVGLFRLSTRVTQLDTAIRGVNGDNGIAGGVKEVRAAVTVLTERVGTIENHVQSLSTGRRGHG